MLERFRCISYLRIILPKTSIPNILWIQLVSVQWCLFIQCTLAKTIKPNVFWIPLHDQSEKIFMNIFKNVWWTVCLYSRKCIRLKWFRSDKLLKSVFQSQFIPSCPVPLVAVSENYITPLTPFVFIQYWTPWFIQPRSLSGKYKIGSFAFHILAFVHLR